MTKIDLSLDIASSASKNSKEWVQNSRQKQDEDRSKKLKEQLRNRYDEEEEENNDANEEQRRSSKKRRLDSHSNSSNSSNLQGLQIMHGMSDFEVGQNVILTLADTSVLDTDETGKIKGINEQDDDILENVNFAERERALDREKQKKRLKQPLYSGYDDAEFDEGLQPGVKPSILSHYDKQKKRTAKLKILNENEITFNSVKDGNGDEDQNQRKQDQIRRKYESLSMELKPASAFLTEEEIKFRKTQKDRKKLKSRKIVKEEQPLDEQPAAVVPSSSNAADSENYDLKDIFGNGEEGETQPTGSGVVVKTEAKPSSSSFSSSSNRKVKFDSFVYEDEDADLALALSRARQLALKKRQEEAARMEVDKEDRDDDDDLDRGAKIAREMTLQAKKENSKMKEDHENDNNDLEEIDVDGRKSDGKLIFNSTTEFATRLQARVNENARSKAEAALREMERSSVRNNEMDQTGLSSLNKAGTASMTDEGSTMDMDDASRSIGKAQPSAVGNENTSHAKEGNDEDDGSYDDWEELNDEEMSVGTASMSKHNAEDNEDDPLSFLHHQPTVSKGMAGALELLRSSGEFKKSNELAGRAKDQRAIDPSNVEFGVQIEYRDDYGRKLTQKEAFRQLSYKFHGHGPGKKKLEKRLKQMEAQNKITKSRTNVLEGNAGTMKSLTTTQEATGKAHIVVQGGGNVSSSVIHKLAANMVERKQHT
jgi:U4/U6.U5 tri-snRNP-associated protein 1